MNIVDKGKVLYRLLANTGQPKVFSFHDCLPDVFSSYLELLITKRYRILGAQELLERVSLPRSSANSVPDCRKESVLTFDDGRRNCWTVIFPLLKKYKIKAMMFVIPERIKQTDENYPNLEDYWKGKVSWENLYMSHRRVPYLTWRELEIMQQSGLVDIFSHSLAHEVASISSRVIDFQNPGVYEMPVYFDEWFQSKMPALDTVWGSPIYERAWVPLISNAYMSNTQADTLMNDFVKKMGGYLFFKKKNWRSKLFEFFKTHKKTFLPGHFKRLEKKEEARVSIFDSKKMIEQRLKNSCIFFSLPLYQANESLLDLIEEAGYRIVFGGSQKENFKNKKVSFLYRLPSFWIKFLSYL